MKLVKFEVNGHEVEFVCESRNTRNGFAHDATLLVNSCQWSTGHRYYLNRTWEAWTYQSACLEACCKAIANRTEQLRMEYKLAHNVSRISKKVREYLANDDELVFVREIMKVLERETF